MRPAKNFFRAIFLLLPILFLTAANSFAAKFDHETADDYAPEITARVARISFAREEAQIRRAGEKDWERAAQNLPIVEGDEIATSGNARLEIQFDSRTFLRLAENSYLKITTLKDEGIALSLPEGSLSARVLQFDKREKYFEIDAPKTTIAIESAGTYRVDAGNARKSSEVRVSVIDDGEAHLYSENSGFTLHSGRSARIYLEGNYAGEWETSDAARYADDFDAWALERDSVIAKRLQTAAYDKYYDRDIYGAEDLGDYGEWIYTKKYGYVWRPFKNAISSYADWSPYRYGQWRWLPQYGWTWVNDEPWGWATYHHGRWVYVDDVWAWTPYAQNRSHRSWWRPALVIINYVGSSICWYPLPYSYNYYNYNSTYVDRRRTTIINNTTVIVNPTPTPASPNIIEGGGRLGNPRIPRKPPIGEVPPTGVVAVDANDFGRGGARNFKKPPVETAEKFLQRTPPERDDSAAPSLPTHNDLNGKISREIIAKNPRAETSVPRIQTGAGERKAGAPADENLRREQIFGGRPPVQRTTPAVGENDAGATNVKPESRETGAVKRMPRTEIVRDGNSDNETPGGRVVRSTDSKSEDSEGGEAPGAKPRGRNREREQSPPAAVSSQPPTGQPRRERRQESPPQPQQEERREPPQRREPPPEREKSPPRSEPPRNEPKPQQREEKHEPPQRQSPPGKKESVDKDS